MIINDLGWRVELRAESGFGLGQLLAVAYRRIREGDWMVATRTQRTPWSVPDKPAALSVLDAYHPDDPDRGTT